LLRCGCSRQGWFCQGAHLGRGKVFYDLRLSEAGTMLMCRCGRSHRYFLCDGRHAAQPRRLWWRPWR
jgi:CDGSH-type Zn-finger protein